MKDPVAEFKTKVVACEPGFVLVYHVGSLAVDSASSPTLTHIQMMSYGLYLMGRVGLRQTRERTEEGAPILLHPKTEYSFKVLQPINALDFDTARKTYLDSVKV